LGAARPPETGKTKKKKKQNNPPGRAAPAKNKTPQIRMGGNTATKKNTLLDTSGSKKKKRGVGLWPPKRRFLSGKPIQIAKSGIFAAASNGKKPTAQGKRLKNSEGPWLHDPPPENPGAMEWVNSSGPLKGQQDFGGRDKKKQKNKTKKRRL